MFSHRVKGKVILHLLCEVGFRQSKLLQLLNEIWYFYVFIFFCNTLDFILLWLWHFVFNRFHQRASFVIVQKTKQFLDFFLVVWLRNKVLGLRIEEIKFSALFWNSFFDFLSGHSLFHDHFFKEFLFILQFSVFILTLLKWFFMHHWDITQKKGALSDLIKFLLELCYFFLLLTILLF